MLNFYGSFFTLIVMYVCMYVTTSVLNFSLVLNDVIVLLGFYLSGVCQASIPLYTTVQFSYSVTK